ncbi:MAG: zinc ribbon domain-containing protein [Clostridia bacterium]|nr:zinc ribbon domain-containing protein [Clostridia bacterium]
MGMIMYGTKVFTKFKGYYGEKVECPCCRKTYKKSYVKYTTWFHINAVPLFPVNFTYYKMCPICGDAEKVKVKQAKAEMVQTGELEGQQLEAYAKHILANKPKGFLAVDNSYEFWVKDLLTGEEICVATNLTKNQIKDMKKERGLKDFKTYEG